jgi:2-polyprenyl-3-methyl-5-hydroxy-6-metoxy-1,4-benzoquinol methylase
MNITNPLFKEMLELGVVTKKNIIKISNKTRDSLTSVYQDKKTGVIFLGKQLTNEKYFKKGKYDTRSISKKSKRVTNHIITLEKTIKSPYLKDDNRRVLQFKKYIKNKRVLDFGCAWGGFLYKCSKYAKYVCGIEVGLDFLTHFKNNLKKIPIYKNLNHINQKFHLITLFHVLHYIPNQVQHLKKLKDKLFAGGFLVIEVPSSSDLLLSIKDFNDFKNFTFNKEQLILHNEFSLKKVLKKSGFKKIQIKYFQRYNFNNHLGWFIKKKPGGQNFYKNIFDKKIINEYTNFLIRNKKTDTLIAIAKK